MLPEVVALRDATGEGRIQLCERILGDTVVNVQVQVTLPLDVYSYFSALRKTDRHTETLHPHVTPTDKNMEDFRKFTGERGRSRRWNLLCQFSHILPGVVQHVAHTEYGAEWPLLRMVGTHLDVLLCHWWGNVPADRKQVDVTNHCFQLLEERVHVRVTYRVTLKRGKRMLFLMKMVKLITSSIGSLRRVSTGTRGWVV